MLESAVSAIVESELDPKRRALWEQLRRASEIEAVKVARETLEEDEDEQKPHWKTRSRALGELQYWLIATGNADAESALLDMVQKFYDSDRWVAVEADGHLRKAWTVHHDAGINLRMESARTLLRQGKARESADLFSQIASSCEPAWAEPHRWRAKVLNMAMHKPDDAMAAYDAALASSPRNYALMFEYGSFLCKDAAVEAALGGCRAAGSAERAARGAELLGRAAELNPLLREKVQQVLHPDEDDDFF